MFSNADIRDIYQSFPPPKDTKGATAGLSSLCISSDGEQLVHSQTTIDEFQRIANAESGRVSIAELSNKLGLDRDATLSVVQRSPSLALLSADRLSIITANERDSLEQRLREAVAHEIVSRVSFSRENDVSVESLDDLLRTMQSGDSSFNGITTVDDYLVGNDYQENVLLALRQQLSESLTENKPIELSTRLLPGEPPKWFLSKVLDEVLSDPSMASQFHMSEDGDSIRCTPKASITQHRDAEFAELQAGNIPCIDLQEHFKAFSELYSSPKDVEGYALGPPTILVQGATAISTTWISNFANQCVGALEVLGYADVMTRIKDAFPVDCRGEVFRRSEEQVFTVYPQKIAAGKTSDDCELHKTGDFILTKRRYEAERELLLDSSRTHAIHQWSQLKEHPEKEMKFQMTDIIAFIPDDQPILEAISSEVDVKKVVEEHFWNEIATLESQNDAEFSTFWVDRVLARTGNYTQGLKSISDTKLQEQLSELLSGYLSKELLLDSIAKARSQGLICSRKIRKNIQKFESALKASKPTATAVVAALEKFGKKQGIQDLDTISLEKTKESLVADLVRKMQKQSDGPGLFLLLILVLFAQYSSGVVYATGKFAPKLLKQLKSSLNGEQYDLLETWKDKAKAGSLTAEDKESMRQLKLHGGAT